jgi:hypothetical protein
MMSTSFAQARKRRRSSIATPPFRRSRCPSTPTRSSARSSAIVLTQRRSRSAAMPGSTLWSDWCKRWCGTNRQHRRATLDGVPTRHPRHTLTETGEVADALALARGLLPHMTDSERLRRLIVCGAEALSARASIELRNASADGRDT